MTSSRDPYRPTLTTDADVTSMWQTLFEEPGWRTTRIYIMVVDQEHRPTPIMTEVDETPHPLAPEDAVGLISSFARVLEEFEPSGSLAVLMCRPGTDQLTEEDRSGCRHLYAAARQAGTPLELLHVGTDTAIVPAPMDAVLPRSARGDSAQANSRPG